MIKKSRHIHFLFQSKAPEENHTTAAEVIQ